MKYVVDGDVILSRPLEGPLSAHIGAFAQWAPIRDTRVSQPMVGHNRDIADAPSNAVISLFSHRICPRRSNEHNQS